MRTHELEHQLPCTCASTFRVTDPSSGVNTVATEWFGLSALPHRGDFAHDGWAIDVLEALARPREEAIRIRSVVE